MTDPVAAWDQRRAKTKGHRTGSAERNQCLLCGTDPFPRTFYCSDECSRTDRANRSAALIAAKERESAKRPRQEAMLPAQLPPKGALMNEGA